MYPTKYTKDKQNVVNAYTEDLANALQCLVNESWGGEKGHTPIPSGISPQWLAEVKTNLTHAISQVETIEYSVESISLDDTGETHE